MLTACAFGYAGPRPRHLEQRHRAPPPPGPRRLGPRRGRRGRGRPALRLAGGGRGLLSQQPLHLARRRRGPFRHPPLHRPGPAPGPLDLQRPADLPEQPGLPPGLLDAHPAVDARRSRRRRTPRRARWGTRRCSRPSRSSARRAATSRRARDSWSGRGWSPPTPTWWRARATATPRCSSGAPPMARRPCSSTPPSTWPSCAPMRRSARPSPSAPTWCRGEPRPRCLGYPEDGILTIGPAGVTEEVTAIGKDIYNNGSVTRGVYALDADVLPGNSGGPLMGPGGQVIGVVFSRSTVYPDVGYALTSPGVLTRVQAAAQHRSRGRAPGPASRAEPGKNEAMSQRIEDYAVIGDLHTAALVGHGRLDRLAVPAALRLAVVLRPAARRRGPRLLADCARRGASAVLATRRWYRPTRSCSRPSSTPPPARCGSPTACPCGTATRTWCARSRASAARWTCTWSSPCASTTARWSPGSPRTRA